MYILFDSWLLDNLELEILYYAMMDTVLTSEVRAVKTKDRDCTRKAYGINYGRGQILY